MKLYKCKLSFHTFKTEFYQKQIPCIITDSINHWKSLELWKLETNYIKKKVGKRIVPIETKIYTNFEKKTMKLEDYLDRLDEDNIGYFAQYPFFQENPELMEDFNEPIFCKAGNGDSYGINLWLGPKGTISPLHRDPNDNILCQVFGSKYIRIYHEKSEKNLYPKNEFVLRNTSKIEDIYHVNEDNFPNFKNEPYWDGEIHQGDILFIPKRFWHYIQSLEKSCSINFWFR